MTNIKSADARGWEEKFYSIKDDLIEHSQDFSRYESGYYWCDKKHYGLLFVSAKLIEKYQLNVLPEDQIQFWIDECPLDQKERAQCLEHYAYAVYLYHAEAFSITKGGLDFSDGNYTKTPHGECYSKQFVAWFNEFSVELFAEDASDLKVVHWCDG